MRVSLLAAAFGAVTMLAAPALAQEKSMIDCTILKSESRGFVDLVGQLSSPKAVSGTYEFTMEKRGGGGSSSVAQSGDFRLAAGESRTIGLTRVNRDQGTRLQAKLTVKWAGGRKECSVDGRTLAELPDLDGKASVSSSANTAITVQRGSSNSSVIVQSN